MNKRTEALMRFRLSATSHDTDGPPIWQQRRPARALFIGCSESPATASLVAATDPTSVILNLGARVPASASEGAGLAALEGAIADRGVSHVVLCGHSRCSRHPRPASHEAGEATAPGLWKWVEMMTRQAVVLELKRLREHPVVRERSHFGDLELHALWLDEAEGDVWLWSPRSRSFTLLDDVAMEAFLTRLENPVGGAARPKPVTSAARAA